MHLTRALYRNSVFFFALFMAGALLGFWPNYLSEILDETDFHVHLHGLVMTLWLLMLIGQASFIRGNRRDLHRLIGKFSYILGPITCVSMVVIVHNFYSQLSDLNERSYLEQALFLGYAPLFALAYGLAIYHRKDASTHARYMLCTPLPMTGPIFNRVLLFYVAPQVDFLPRFHDGSPFPLYLTLPAIDLLLLGLAVWDWRVHRRLDVFPIMLVAFICLQGTAFWVYDSDVWRAFSGWFLRMPLS